MKKIYENIRVSFYKFISLFTKKRIELGTYDCNGRRIDFSKAEKMMEEKYGS